MSRPQKLCAYCSKPGATKEHYWGRWSKKHVPHVTPYTTHTVTRTFGVGYSDHPIVMVDQGLAPRQGDMRAQSLKVVCKSCNEGWMKDVNEAAEPHLARLGQRDWWSLSDAEKTAISAWATMFTMTWEFADRVTLASPQTERDYLRTNREPPPNWAIWVGSYGEGAWTHQMNHHGGRTGSVPVDPADLLVNFLNEPDVRISPNMNCQITVLTFNHLLIVTFSHRVESPVDWESFGVVLGLQVIWPPTRETIERPLRDHTDTEVEAIAFGLRRNLMPGLGPPPDPGSIPMGWKPVE